MTVSTALTIGGIGLITGEPVEVRLEKASAGHGIVFHPKVGDPIPARLGSVVNTERGVTLANRQGQTLSIVEHFLCACSMAGLEDADVYIEGVAPELPILDGSARPWLERIQANFGSGMPMATRELRHAVFYRHTDDIAVYAIPADHFQVSYAVDFSHPGLRSRWVHWNSQRDGLFLAGARTFGFVHELPIMQAKGLARGVRPDNTLGLTEDGGYTETLRFDDEPVYHKILDLIGDLTLAGVNPMTVKAHIFALNAGHGSHTAFARQWLTALTP